MSELFTLNLKDVSRGVIMAALGGAFLPILAMFQTPGFDVFSVNWSAVITLAINGAILGFSTYLIKNFFSDKSGSVLGKIG